jgi:hypothetical protein
MHDESCRVDRRSCCSTFFLAARGTIELGKVVDVVVWTGDPFELATRAELVIIGGIVQTNESHQSKLLQRYRKLK